MLALTLQSVVDGGASTAGWALVHRVTVKCHVGSFDVHELYGLLAVAGLVGVVLFYAVVPQERQKLQARMQRIPQRIASLDRSSVMGGHGPVVVCEGEVLTCDDDNDQATFRLGRKVLIVAAVSEAGTLYLWPTGAPPLGLYLDRFVISRWLKPPVVELQHLIDRGGETKVGGITRIAVPAESHFHELIEKRWHVGDEFFARPTSQGDLFALQHAQEDITKVSMRWQQSHASMERTFFGLMAASAIVMLGGAFAYLAL